MFRKLNLSQLQIESSKFWRCVSACPSRLAECGLLHPVLQRYLGTELQPDVSVCQRGGLRPGQRDLHLLPGLEGGILRRAVSCEWSEPVLLL